jgi:hypothetical protein
MPGVTIGAVRSRVPVAALVAVALAIVVGAAYRLGQTSHPSPRTAPAAPPPRPQKPVPAPASAGLAAAEPSEIRVASFGTRPREGARECFGEVRNGASVPARDVKVIVRCDDRGQKYLQQTAVEPGELGPGQVGTFKALLAAPDGSGWTAEVVGSGVRVAETPLAAPSEPAPAPAATPVLPPPSPPAAVFGSPELHVRHRGDPHLPAAVALANGDLFRHLVEGTVYNRGDGPGRAEVRIVGREGSTVHFSRVVPLEPPEVPPHSEARFQAQFQYPGDAESWHWTAELIRNPP